MNEYTVTVTGTPGDPARYESLLDGLDVGPFSGPVLIGDPDAPQMVVTVEADNARAAVLLVTTALAPGLEITSVGVEPAD